MDLWTLTDLATPWCVHVVVTLRVPDHIAAGKTEITELARACHADAESLGRVMRHLVHKGVFEERPCGNFRMNDFAKVLLEPPARYGLDLHGIGGRMAHAWSTLLRAVETGTPAYHEVFGQPFWNDLAAHPEVAASFDALMGPGHGTPDPDVLIRDDWQSVKTVVDVGGGTGSLLAALLRAHPTLRGILVDLPATVGRSSEVFRSAGVADRVSAVGQSFFVPLPAGGDLYLLKSVLGDWPDREAGAILRRCAEAARPAGRVVLLNGVSPDAAGPPPEDLLMMVLVGGKNRSLSEFRKLAEGAGLQVTEAAPHRSGRFLVECRPVPLEGATA